jgi:hypothetical protein
MIHSEAVEAMVEQYQKFGWRLRRILLSVETFGPISQFIRERFPDVSIEQHEINALWFSRANREAETWELRRLTGPPFALVQVIEANTAESEREEILRSIENRMSETPEKSPGEIPLEK